MKLPNFGSPSNDISSKIGRHFRNKTFFWIKLSKNTFCKKGAPKLIFFNEKKIRKIRMIFDHEKADLLWPSEAHNAPDNG